MKRVVSTILALALMLQAGSLAYATASEPLSTDQIKVTNKLVGTDDEIFVAGLSTGYVVKVYTTEDSNTAISTATVPIGGASVKIIIPQLGVNSGQIYMTVTKPALTESERIVKTFTAEPQTAAPPAGTITVFNNSSGATDFVNVKELEVDDVVKVYTSPTSTTPIATGKANGSNFGAYASIPIPQLGTTSGTIYVTNTTKDKSESPRVDKIYSAEEVTSPLALNNIRVEHNANGTPDKVTVLGLNAGDIVKVYADHITRNELGTATVANGKTSAELSIAEIGVKSDRIYVTVTSATQFESHRVSKMISRDLLSDSLKESSITVKTSTKGAAADSVIVSDLNAGDLIKVYADHTTTTTLSTAIVAPGSTNAEVSIVQEGLNTNDIYVSVVRVGRTESDRVKKSISTESLSDSPNSSDIIITNNGLGSSDTVMVNNLVAGDVVKVYQDEAASTVLGTSSVTSGESSTTVTISQVGESAGILYVTVTRSPKAESKRISKSFQAEVPQDVMAQNFHDIESHWANHTIASAVSKGYVDGYEDGSFKPDQSVTRAEFVTLLAKALKIPVVQSTADKTWYAPYVNSVVRLGYHKLEDFDDEWDKPITRVEMARIAVRVLNPQLIDSSEANSMYLATSKGIIQGVNGGSLEKSGSTTRAQSITVIERIMSIQSGRSLEIDQEAVKNAEKELAKISILFKRARLINIG